MQSDVEQVLIPHAKIAERVREMASRITRDHLPSNGDEPAELTIVTILTGAMIFAADLMRHLPIRMKIGLLTVSSYPGATTQSKGSKMLAGQLGDLRGRHVLVIDDILDSGGTIQFVRNLLQQHEPATIKACVLLRKPTPGAAATPVEYVGFDIPDEFVVGYGLDYDDYYRNLPDIVTLKRHVVGRAEK